MESGDKGKHEKQGCEGAGRQKRQDHRRSLINLETSRDEELDAILGDLTLLQGEFETEIQEDRRRKASSQATEEECHCRGAISEETGSSSGSVRQAGERRYAGVRVKSPDTDSAFCDNISLLSSCSGGNGEGRGHRFTEKEEASGIVDMIKHCNVAGTGHTHRRTAFLGKYYFRLKLVYSVPFRACYSKVRFSNCFFF